MSGVALPLGVFLLAQAFYSLAAVQAGYHPLGAKAWDRWDSWQYKSIAGHGYDFRSCAGMPGYNLGDWCGNGGWLPGYPLLFAAVARLGLSLAVAGVWVAGFFNLAGLIVLWNGFLRRGPRAAAVMSLVLFEFFPGSIYFHALFPISMFLFLVLVFLYLLEQDRVLAAGVVGGCAAFTYSTGFLLALVMAFYLARRLRAPLPELGRIVLAGVLVALGFAGVLLMQHLQAGRWNAFFLVQAKYGHGLHNPVQVYAERVAGLMSDKWSVLVQALQTTLAAVLLLLAGAMATRRRPEADSECEPGEATEPDEPGEPGEDERSGLLLCYLLCFWGFPYVMGHGASFYRAESLLAPSVVLLRHLPFWALLVLLLLAEALANPIGQLFFQGTLI